MHGRRGELYASTHHYTYTNHSPGRPEKAFSNLLAHSLRHEAVLHLERTAHTVRLQTQLNIYNAQVEHTWGGYRAGPMKNCQYFGLGGEKPQRVICLLLCPSAWHTHANTQWSMKAEWVKWKKGDELTASAKGCPEKLRLNGGDV